MKIRIGQSPSTPSGPTFIRATEPEQPPTKILANREVQTSSYPKYSETSIPNTPKAQEEILDEMDEKLARLVRAGDLPPPPSMMPIKRFLGIPVNLLMFLLIMSTVLAVGIYATVNRTWTVSSPVEVNSANIPTNPTLYANDEVVYPFTIKSLSNRNLNANINVRLTNSGLSSGDVTLVLLNSADSVIATASGPSSGVMSISNFALPAMTKDVLNTYKIKITLAPDAPLGEYSLVMELNPV